MPTDDMLYADFLAGNDSAFDELMRRYGDNLTMYLKGYLASFQDAEDMMIVAFSKIMFRRPKIREGNFKVYLFKTGRNLVSEFYKRKKKLELFDFESLEDEPAAEEALDEHFWNEQRKKILHECLGRIDDETREAYWLVYFENMSYEEAATVMKVNVKKINNLLTRGKDKIREELAKEGIEGFYQ
ncbi:MAG: sigma-70 family RNA polymerase sigma factor [Lachnospiraceae bacterium]|nr:sigma-70 family RNA polymerase sigma factor [Lachnospiraceae bacterium]